MKSRRIRLTDDTRGLLDRYINALLTRDWQWESTYGQSVSSKVFLHGDRPSYDVFMYLLTPALDFAADGDLYYRASYAARSALLHPLCPPDLLARASVSPVMEYRTIAMQHPNCPEAAAVAVALSRGTA